MIPAVVPFGLPARKYHAILADPPWHFKARTALQMSNPGSRRDAERHYKTMSLHDIAALPVSEIAHKDCHLFLWATGPNLAQAFEVMENWGFRYSAMAFVWVKLRRAVASYPQLFLGECDLHVGLGLTTRHNAEFCLLGRRGNPRRSAKDVREIIMAPVRAHSQKPDETYTRIERYCDGPYVELFARHRRNGWHSWGDQLPELAVAAE